ncbi:hypothetical protein GCM10011612_16230 [Actinomyces gaoshouyii]|uniref:Transcriptional regulator LacI/GalR-like sensor domain-containing protein n=1 Tax=Actinomyces gaoshouyii TaxID=1960083 RepID=A0A8H9HAZ2_9ACTO|nr:substrate-binding domain-containing protein [Actinomyces gaoshouyii]GGO99299.1 hypothetical protein GCM10011612_16230 [Actinomyces gaoshouyii]
MSGTCEPKNPGTGGSARAHRRTVPAAGSTGELLGQVQDRGDGAAIKELGFVRSETARRLRHGGSSLTGVLVHDISNPFFTEAARGIEDRLRQDGRVPMVGSTDSDPHRDRELMSVLAGLDVRGVIVTPSAFTLDNLAVLAGRGIRVVLMDHPAISDKVLVEVEAVHEGASYCADAGAVGAARLLDDPEPPTALFCANDQMAIGAMRVIRDRGLRIPQDVAIVGYDASPSPPSSSRR